MKTAGVRELKNRLSEYLREVRSGETVLVTDRGEVVAELRPPGGSGGVLDLPPDERALRRMIAEGWVHPPSRHEGAPPPVKLTGKRPTAEELDALLDELREDKF